MAEIHRKRFDNLLKFGIFIMVAQSVLVTQTDADKSSKSVSTSNQMISKKVPALICTCYAVDTTRSNYYNKTMNEGYVYTSVENIGNSGQFELKVRVRASGNTTEITESIAIVLFEGQGKNLRKLCTVKLWLKNNSTHSLVENPSGRSDNFTRIRIAVNQSLALLDQAGCSYEKGQWREFKLKYDSALGHLQLRSEYKDTIISEWRKAGFWNVHNITFFSFQKATTFDPNFEVKFNCVDLPKNYTNITKTEMVSNNSKSKHNNDSTKQFGFTCNNKTCGFNLVYHSIHGNLQLISEYNGSVLGEWKRSNSHNVYNIQFSSPQKTNSSNSSDSNLQVTLNCTELPRNFANITATATQLESISKQFKCYNDSVIPFTCNNQTCGFNLKYNSSLGHLQLVSGYNHNNGSVLHNWKIEDFGNLHNIKFLTNSSDLNLQVTFHRIESPKNTTITKSETVSNKCRIASVKEENTCNNKTPKPIMVDFQSAVNRNRSKSAVDRNQSKSVATVNRNHSKSAGNIYQSKSAGNRNAFEVRILKIVLLFVSLKMCGMDMPNFTPTFF